MIKCFTNDISLGNGMQRTSNKKAIKGMTNEVILGNVIKRVSNKKSNTRLYN